MSEQQNNGHAPAQQAPQPAPHHAMQIMQARAGELRDKVADLENQLDYARAMWSTAGEQLQGLAAENSRLIAENDQLKAAATATPATVEDAPAES